MPDVSKGTGPLRPISETHIYMTGFADALRWAARIARVHDSERVADVIDARLTELALQTETHADDYAPRI